MSPRTTFYHYTCEHGFAALGVLGTVRPLLDWNPDTVQRIEPARRNIATVSWFTDLDVPHVRALGLTRTTIRCDRTRYRYRVLEPELLTPWLYSPLRTGWLLDLERARGAMPRHWYVSALPVRVRFDPIK